MSKRVFISHSSEDSKIAEQVCQSLESAGIQCWMAPRDIMSGEKWAEAIASAVLSSSALIIIFSDNANQSKHVAHELTMAYSKGIQIIPYKIEEVEPDGALQFYLTGAHWLEAKSPTATESLDQLVAVISSCFGPQQRQTEHNTSPKASKVKWADLILALALLTLVGLAAMVYFFDQPVALDTFFGQVTVEETSINWHIRGNSSGNIANLGLVATDGDRVYFSNVGKNFYLYSMHPDGTIIEQLNEDQTYYINLVGDWIYYVNGSDNDTIYKIKTDGSEKERMGEESSAYLQLVGEWLFYADFSDGGHGHVHRLNLNSGERRVLFHYGGAHLNFTNEYIYYINREDGEKVYRQNLAGFNERVDTLDSYRAVSLLANEHGLYFINATMGEELWGMIDSGDAQELVDGPVKFINCDDQGLYYISSRDNPEIYRIDYDGQNRMKLNNNTELNPFYLNIAGNWVYYIDRSSKTEQLYRIHKDGGQPELVGGEYNGP